MRWMSSDRRMYAQFTSCTQGVITWLISSKLEYKNPKWSNWRHSEVFIVDFVQVIESLLIFWLQNVPRNIETIDKLQ